MTTPHELNGRRADHRQFLESMCGGVSEKKDLEKIFRIQKMRSYFSGEPLDPEKLNASLDHLKPVRLQGSFWPGNLAYLTREENQEKHGRTKAQYWSFLEKKNGADWVNERKKVAKKIDAERRAVHRNRRREVKNILKEMDDILAAIFPSVYIGLELLGDSVMMHIDDTIIFFSSDFLRKKRKFKSTEYYKKIIRALMPYVKEMQPSQITVGQPCGLSQIL